MAKPAAAPRSTGARWRVGVDAFWTADRRLCRTADGKVVERDDPRAAFLLVGEGGQLPMAEAVALGLVRDGDPKPKAPRRPSVEERGRLIWALMEMYGADIEFHAALGKLGALADTVDPMPLESWRLRRPPSVSRDAPQARYRDLLADTACDFGLDRLPSVGGNPGGQDLLHAWAANRSRRPAFARKPERFALAATFGGPVPLVRFASPGDKPEPDGEPPRIVVEWDIADEPRKAVLNRICAQMDGVEEWWSERGYPIGRGKATKTLTRDMRALFDWMRHGGKPTDTAAQRGARRLASHLNIDLRRPRAGVTSRSDKRT